MNKYQEAIKDFKEYVEWLKGHKMLSQKSSDYLDNKLSNLQELVDKATPKKPKVISKPYGHLIFEEYYCPVCHAQMGRNDCCSNNECRQAIDWS